MQGRRWQKDCFDRPHRRKRNSLRVTKATQTGMNWPQEFDDAPMLSLNFHLKLLPAVFVMDGDSGHVLTQGMSIRDEALGPVLDALLKQREVTFYGASN